MNTAISMIVLSAPTTRNLLPPATSGKPELTGAIRTLETAGVNLLGIVVTMLPTKGPDSYGYGSYTYGSKTDHGQDPVQLTQAESKPRVRVRAKAK